MQLTGANASLRVGFETTFGTPATTMYEMPFIVTSADFNTTQELQQSEENTGKRSEGQGFLGNKNGQGSLTVPLRGNSFGFWMKAALGNATPVNNGDGTFTHTFTINNTVLPSLTIEVAHLDKANTFYRHVGFKVNTAEIALGGDGELVMTLSFVGQDSTSETTQVAVPDTSLKSGVKYQNFDNVVSGIASASDVRNYTVNISNDLDESSYTVNKQGARNDIPHGFAPVTGNLEANFTGDGLNVSSAGFITESLVSTLTSGTESIVITVNELKLDKIIGQPISSAQGILTNLNWRAFHENGAVESSIIVELTNTIAAY